MEAVRNLGQVKNNWTPHTIWEQRQNEDEQCFDELKNKLLFSAEEISYSKKRGKVITDAVKTMDQLSINKSENAMVAIKTALSSCVTALSLIGLGAGYMFSKFRKSATKTPKMTAVIWYSVFALVGSSVASFISAHYEKKATRIARYQARNNEMKDIRNFVVYDDEQIEQAKKTASTMSDVEDITEDMTMKESLSPKKVFKKSFEAIKSLNKDYSNYKKWHNSYVEQEKKKKTDNLSVSLTPQEEIQAQKDKNVILKTIRKLEIGSNDYEINFDFAVKTAAILASIATVAGGFMSFWAFGKLAGRSTNKLLSRASDLLSKLSIPAGIAGLFLIVGPITKLSKDSSKVGRYKETQRLFSHDRNFVPHTDEQIQEIRKKRKFRHHHPSVKDTLVKDISGLFKIKSDFVNYNKYKNTELKEHLKIKEALKTIPISERQKLEAQKLQKELFMAFEKIDDKTESFVDDTSAFTDVCSKLLTGSACTIANILTLKLLGSKISQLTNSKTMPGFFEGLKLSKNLSFKNIGLIFLLPFAITRGILFLSSLVSAEIQKKACKIGMMEALKELNDSKNFAEKELLKDENGKKAIFADFIKKQD